MRTIFGWSGAALALLVAAPASSQPAADPLWSTQGQLQEADDADAEQHRYDDFVLSLEAGRRYAISASSGEFDTLIRLYRPGETDPVAENDDSGNSLDSRIVYTAAASGDHILRVTAFSADGRGAYTARLDAVPPLPPPSTAPGTPVTVTGTWSLWQGELGPSDPDQDGHHYDDYLIRAEAGRPRYISLEADGFDALVQVLSAAGRDSDPPAAVDGDDDAGAGFNALLAFAPEESSDYVVRVTSFQSGGVGRYRLWISQ